MYITAIATTIANINIFIPALNVQLNAGMQMLMTAMAMSTMVMAMLKARYRTVAITALASITIANIALDSKIALASTALESTIALESSVTLEAKANVAIQNRP